MKNRCSFVNFYEYLTYSDSSVLFKSLDTKHTRSTTKCFVRNQYFIQHIWKNIRWAFLYLQWFFPLFEGLVLRIGNTSKVANKKIGLLAKIFSNVTVKGNLPQLSWMWKKYVMCSFFCEIDSWYFSQILPIFHQPYIAQ